MINDEFKNKLNELYLNSINYYKYYSSRIYYSEPNKIYIKCIDLFYDTLDTILEILDIGKEYGKNK